jgi:hypothetical protein
VTDTPSHLRSGLSARFVDNQGIIIAPAWHRAVEGKELVGSCRATGCDGHLVPDETQTSGRLTFYTAHCIACGVTVVAPNGKTLPRSTRRDEMPDGAWEIRMKNMNAAFGKEG